MWLAIGALGHDGGVLLSWVGYGTCEEGGEDDSVTHFDGLDGEVCWSEVREKLRWKEEMY